jgi:hypothetical protein
MPRVIGCASMGSPHMSVHMCVCVYMHVCLHVCLHVCVMFVCGDQSANRSLLRWLTCTLLAHDRAPSARIDTSRPRWEQPPSAISSKLASAPMSTARSDTSVRLAVNMMPSPADAPIQSAPTSTLRAATKVLLLQHPSPLQPPPSARLLA